MSVFKALFSLCTLFLFSSSALAQSPVSERWSSALFAESVAGYVPVANDVPLMLGLGVRALDIHEVWTRVGYMPTGDDVGHGFAVVGYRAAFRPRHWIRPIVGAYFAGLPATCTHDEQGRPLCTPEPLFILSATGGIRLEPTPWFGAAFLLSLGADSYPNPFGMAELALSFALPLGP